MALTGEEEELASALRPALPHLLRTGSSSSPFYCPFSKVGQNVLRRFTSDGKLPSLLEELDHAPCGGSFKSEAALYQHVHALARQEEELHAILLSVIDQQPTQTPAHKRPKLELPPIEGEEVPMPLMLLIDFSTKDFDSAGKLKELFKGFQPDMHLPKYLPNHCTGEVLLVWFDVIKLSDAQSLQVQLDKNKREYHVRSTRWASREDWAVWEQKRPKWVSKLVDRQRDRGGVEWQPVSHWLAQARKARQDTQQLAGQQEGVIGQLQSQLKEQEVKLEEGRRELEAMRAKLEQAQSNAGQAGVEEMEMLFQKLEVQRAVNMGEKVLKQHSESYLKKIELDREIKSREMELRVHGLVLEDKKQREVEHFQQTVLDQRVIEQRVQEQMKQQEKANKLKLESILRELTDDHDQKMAEKEAELAKAKQERDQLESEAGVIDTRLFYKFMQRDSEFRDFESKMQATIVAKIEKNAPEMTRCVRRFGEIIASDLKDRGILPNNEGDLAMLTSIWSERLMAAVPPERDIKRASAAEKEEMKELKRLGFPEPFHPPWIFKKVTTLEGSQFVIREEDEVLPFKPPNGYEEGSEAYKLYCAKFREANTMHTGFVKMIRRKYRDRAQGILDYLKKKYEEFLKEQRKANAQATILWNISEDREMTIFEKFDTLLTVHQKEVAQLRKALRQKED